MEIFYAYRYTDIDIFIQAESMDMARVIGKYALQLHPSTNLFLPLFIGYNQDPRIYKEFVPYSNMRCFLLVNSENEVSLPVIPYYTREEKIDLLLC